MNAPNGTLIIDAVIASRPNLVPGDIQQAYEATTPSTNTFVVGIWALAVLVICAFGVLATFASPLFFLAVLVSFVALAVLAGRSS